MSLVYRSFRFKMECVIDDNAINKLAKSNLSNLCDEFIDDGLTSWYAIRDLLEDEFEAEQKSEDLNRRQNRR